MNLRTPGPIPCPDEILEASAKQMINHRGPEFQDLVNNITQGLKKVYRTKNDVLTLTGSGTGSMEAAIVNTLSPGDTVLSVSIGVFGDRFAQIAEAYGAKVEKLTFPWGNAIDPDILQDTLSKNPDIKAVLVTHNETSTGVTNDLEKVAKVVKESDKLLIVDAISSLSSLPFYTDDWGCDVVVAGSQKGWMVAPGLSFISMSDRAWAAFEESKMPKFYWDVGKAKTYLDRGQTPWTPAVAIMYGLEISLKMIVDEGLENVYARHKEMGDTVRNGVKNIGLDLFANESCASNTVTSVHIPEGIEAKELLGTLRTDYNVVIAGGQGSLDGKIMRIGHMGQVPMTDLDEALGSLKAGLDKVGFQPNYSGARG